MTLSIRPLTAPDHDDWRRLWAGYLAFYQHTLTESQSDLTFERILSDFPIWGAIASDDDAAVGIVHWLTHPSTWSDEPYCYLEDLFVDPGARASGVGRALIEHVTLWATDHHLPKVYWQTAYTNSTARGLYDKVASNEFVVYEVDLPG